MMTKLDPADFGLPAVLGFGLQAPSAGILRGVEILERGEGALPSVVMPGVARRSPFVAALQDA